MNNKVKEPFGFNEPASQYIPKPSAVSTGELTDSLKFQEELSKKNTLGDILNSPEMIKMQEHFLNDFLLLLHFLQPI